MVRQGVHQTDEDEIRRLIAHVLQGDGRAQQEDAPRGPAVRSEVGPAYDKWQPPAADEGQGQHHADSLGRHGSHGRPGSPQAKPPDQRQVPRHVDYTGDGYEHQG